MCAKCSDRDADVAHPDGAGPSSCDGRSGGDGPTDGDEARGDEGLTGGDGRSGGEGPSGGEVPGGGEGPVLEPAKRAVSLTGLKRRKPPSRPVQGELV